MKIRQAKISDAETICSLVKEYAEQDLMLFRSRAEVYENLQTFIVAEDNGKVLGCAAVEVIWKDLAEIKSLAIAQNFKAKGIGSKIVEFAVDKACELGIQNIFALTLVPEFFEKNGFKVIPKQQLPMKDWKDCAKCPKQDHCDEIAVIKELSTFP
jgi:amino-acid N-acetyltransferase